MAGKRKAAAVAAEAASKRQRQRDERDSKRLLATVEGEEKLGKIVAQQREARKQSKKQNKKLKAELRRGREEEEEEEVDGEEEEGSRDGEGQTEENGDDEEYDSEVEALKRIKAAKERLAKKQESESGSEEDEEKSEEVNGEGEDDEESLPDIDPEDERLVQAAMNAALLKKLDDFELKLPFLEKYDVVADKVSTFTAVDDDLAREVEFYRQALEAVKAGRAKLEQEKVPHFRPVDYFAEMIKSDEHMARIKQNILFEKKKMEAFEKRKHAQENKKFQKKVAAEKQKEKTSIKKKIKDVAEEFRSKNRESDSILKSKKLHLNNPKAKSSRPSPNARRTHKNKKFGNGGRKGKWAK